MRTDFMNIAAFAAASTTRAGFGAWAHPATNAEVVTAQHYVELARVAEAAGFDFLFFDDRLAMPAALGDSPAEAARLGSRAVKLDLLTILGLVSATPARSGWARPTPRPTTRPSTWPARSPHSITSRVVGHCGTSSPR